MKIDYIKINGFGKIKNKEIDFKDGINIVYGENEAGKSTVLKSILAILYGASKNKNGKNISDCDKYKPWDGSEFSGKLRYTLDSGEEYEVFREFKKKNPVIYNSANEDISKQFFADKTKGINFFEEQVGVDEATFANTAIIGQQEVKLGKTDTNIIVQKISNLISTGDDNISFQKSMDKLTKMRNEQVGTDKTKNKPINIVNEKIQKLLENKKSLIAYKENKDNHSQEKENLIYKLNQEENKKLFLKELKQSFSDLKIKNMEMNFQKDLENEYCNKVNELKEKMTIESDLDTDVSSNKKCKIYTYILIFFVIICATMFVFFKNMIAGVISGISIIGLIIALRKLKKEEIEKLEKVNLTLKKEYEYAVKEYEQKKQEIEHIEKELQLENKKVLKNICEKYKKILGLNYIEDKMKIAEEHIEEEIENIQKNINAINIQKHILDTEKSNIDDKLEEIARIEENLEYQNSIKEELISLDTSFGIAKECLEKAYDNVKHNISPEFEENLCEIIFNITDGKYKNVTVNDVNGLNIEVKNGNYMPVDRLSDGTIDEMYLALRLSTLSEISKENLPIILDETFAYFDNVRLKNVLCYLQDKNYDNQIIIFTCSNREESILNELKIEYNLINLEK